MGVAAVAAHAVYDARLRIIAPLPGAEVVQFADLHGIAHAVVAVAPAGVIVPVGGPDIAVCVFAGHLEAGLAEFGVHIARLIPVAGLRAGVELIAVVLVLEQGFAQEKGPDPLGVVVDDDFGRVTADVAGLGTDGVLAVGPLPMSIDVGDQPELGAAVTVALHIMPFLHGGLLRLQGIAVVYGQLRYIAPHAVGAVRDIAAVIIMLILAVIVSYIHDQALLIRRIVIIDIRHTAAADTDLLESGGIRAAVSEPGVAQVLAEGCDREPHPVVARLQRIVAFSPVVAHLRAAVLGLLADDYGLGIREAADGAAAVPQAVRRL